MSERNRCYIYFKWLKSIDRLTDEQLGQFLRAYYVMQITGDTTLEVDDPMVNMMLDQTREQVSIDIAKYEETCERNRNNGMNGGRPKTQKNPVGYSETQSVISKPTHNPKKPDKDKDIDIDKDSPSENNNPPTPLKRGERFTPPTVDEVRAYCRERNNNVDAEKFVDFYTAKGWKVGKNPMKDWKAAVRTWERRVTDAPQTNTFSSGMMQRPKDDVAKALADLGNRNGNLI